MTPNRHPQGDSNAAANGYAKGYAHILDAAAGDQIPRDLDLAPPILARIQKGKRSRMLFRTKLAAAAVLAVAALAVLFFTVPQVAAAIGRWFGYVPGIGLVREGQVRVLAEPVSITGPDGITMTVEQALLDSEQTTVVYSVEGIPSEALTTNPNERCNHQVTLRLPDGDFLAPTGGSGEYWQTGYQDRFTFPPIPAGVDEATLAVTCLFNARPGAATEGWELPMRFAAAPPNLTAFPVIELPTPTPPAAGEGAQPGATPAGADSAAAADGAAPATPGEGATPPGPAATPATLPITLTLDRAVQMDDGYLIYATLRWPDSPIFYVDLPFDEGALSLLDGEGQPMPYERVHDDQTGADPSLKQAVFAIKTAPVRVPGPLTLVVEAVVLDVPAEASFAFDPGPNPQPGQAWALDEQVSAGGHVLRITAATAQESGYLFQISTDEDVQAVRLFDKDHPMLGSGGGGSGSEILTGFTYDGGLRGGPLTISVASLSVRHTQRLQAQWTPPSVPAELAGPAPTQPLACLTAARWKAVSAETLPLPAGLGGKVVTNGPLDGAANDWGLVLTNLDGSERQVIPNAYMGTLSPDGATLAYSSAGPDNLQPITLLDLASGETTPLPGSGAGDINPIWSPDGTQIVFNRGMGIFDLFITRPDGTDLRQITHGGVQEWPVGWLPDGRSLLVNVPGREYEYTIYQLDVESGESQVFSQENVQAVSPDGHYLLTAERSFGDRWSVAISELDGANRHMLVEPGLWALTPLWSASSQWVLVSVSAGDVADTTGALINVTTCEVVPLPWLKGNILSWVE